MCYNPFIVGTINCRLPSPQVLLSVFFVRCWSSWPRQIDTAFPLISIHWEVSSQLSWVRRCSKVYVHHDPDRSPSNLICFGQSPVYQNLFCTHFFFFKCCSKLARIGSIVQFLMLFFDLLNIWMSLPAYHSSSFVLREVWTKKKVEELNEKSPSDIPQGLSQWLWWKQEKHLTLPMVTSPVFQESRFQNGLFPNLFHLPSQEK